MKSVNELGISPMPWEWDKGVVVCNDGDIEKDVAITVGYDIGIESQETANGRLLAAAPELYECLREAALIEQCHDAETHCEFCPTSSQCRAYRWKKILAKAAEKEANND